MGSQTTTTQGTSQPWGAAQPALKTALGDAQSLYKSGVGSAVNTGSMVTPWSKQTMQGMGQIEGLAGANQNLMGGSIQALQGYAGGGQMGQRNNPMMEQYAGGEFLDGQNNPAFNQVLERTQDETMRRINSQAAQAGRQSSPRHFENAGRGIADVTGRMLSDQYNTEVGNMFGANDRLNQNQGVDFSQMMQAQGQLPGAFQSSLAPSQALMGVGGNYEDLYTRQLNDNARVFDSQQSSGWNQLARLNAIGAGAGQLGGTQTSQASTPRDWLGTAANIGKAGIGAYSGIPIF